MSLWQSAYEALGLLGERAYEHLEDVKACNDHYNVNYYDEDEDNDDDDGDTGQEVAQEEVQEEAAAVAVAACDDTEVGAAASEAAAAAAAMLEQETPPASPRANGQCESDLASRNKRKRASEDGDDDTDSDQQSSDVERTHKVPRTDEAVFGGTRHTLELEDVFDSADELWQLLYEYGRRPRLANNGEEAAADTRTAAAAAAKPRLLSFADAVKTHCPSVELANYGHAALKDMQKQFATLCREICRGYVCSAPFASSDAGHAIKCERDMRRGVADKLRFIEPVAACSALLALHRKNNEIVQDSLSSIETLHAYNSSVREACAHFATRFSAGPDVAAAADAQNEPQSRRRLRSRAPAKSQNGVVAEHTSPARRRRGAYLSPASAASAAARTKTATAAV